MWFWGLEARHQQTDLPLWHHYDILNKLYPLWHYYDTIITLMTCTKVRLSWHIMTKAWKTPLLHLWHDYYRHYDILNILWHLCVLWHHYIHYHILNYYHTYDIEGTIIAYYDNSKTLCTLFPLWHYYIHYCILNFITLMTLRHYYSLLWQLQNIMRISTFVITAIIRIMVIKYCRSYLLTKAEYCVGYWF